MITRFANVVYWAATAIAILFLIGAATAIIKYGRLRLRSAP